MPRRRASSLGVVLLLHAGAVWLAVLPHGQLRPEPSRPLILLTIESNPSPSPMDTPPGPRSWPRPQLRVQEIPPASVPESELPLPPMNSPAAPAMPSMPSAPERVRTSLPVAAGAAVLPATLAQTWQELLFSRLRQFKRYPGIARLRRQQGVVYIRFTMDRGGHVLSAGIERSSGYAALDDEGLALIKRAEPLPRPPPEAALDAIEITIPVQFRLNAAG